MLVYEALEQALQILNATAIQGSEAEKMTAAKAKISESIKSLKAAAKKAQEEEKAMRAVEQVRKEAAENAD